MLEIKVTLRVFSANYSLPELTAVLGDPTNGFSLGDIYGRKERVREQTLWALDSSVPPDEDLESHANSIVAYLDSRAAAIAGLAGKCEMDLFCMLRSDNGQGGATLPCRIMEKLSSYKLGMVFDVYASS